MPLPLSPSMRTVRLDGAILSREGDELDHLPAPRDHRRRGSAIGELASEPRVLAEQGAVLTRVRDLARHVLEEHGLDQVVLRPRVQGLDHRLDAAVGGHEEHGRVGRSLGELGRQGDPILGREPQIDQRHRVVTLGDRGDGRLRGLEPAHLVTLLLQVAHEVPAQGLLVLDDQDLLRHGSSSLPRSPRSAASPWSPPRARRDSRAPRPRRGRRRRSPRGRGPTLAPPWS